MVVFACNHCGESLKKQVVTKHAFRCKRDINVSCMDCQKDFLGNDFDGHTSCISEAEKYSGKGFVPKENKGAKKQESWVNTIRSITETTQHLSPGIKSVFQVIQQNDNVPRKMKSFVNFFMNSCKHIKKADVEAAWALIEKEVNSKKVEEKPSATRNGVSEPATTNGTKVEKESGENGQTETNNHDGNIERDNKKKEKKTKKKNTKKVEQQSETSNGLSESSKMNGTEGKKSPGKASKTNTNDDVENKELDSVTIAVHSITKKKQDLSSGIMSVFKTVLQTPTISRKKKSFFNHFASSESHLSKADVEAAWKLIEEEMKNEKPKQKKKKSKTAKRKMNEQGSEVPAKRQKNEEHDDTDNVQSNDGEKFRWAEEMKAIITEKNEMEVSKLRKKILKKYQKFTGTPINTEQCDGKFEKMFEKKLKKNFVVDNDIVRLIE